MKIKLTKTQYENLLNEMRFDGKSTGLFADEEPKEVNEFGDKMKSFFNNKKEDMLNSWKNFVNIAKREKSETVESVKILGNLLSKKEVSERDIKFLKSQSKDIVKIVAVMSMGAVSMAIPIALEKILNKYGITIMPTRHKEEDEEDVENLNEGRKKKKNKLCARGISAAKSKFDVYPSAYANGYAVQVCKGKIKGLDGNKRCSGSYCSGKTNESWSPEMVQDLDSFHDIEIHEDLAVWFGTKKKNKGTKQPQGPWVNICRKKEGGGHPPCGRPEGESKGYPKCRAAGVAAKMSDSEKKAACAQKRRAEKKEPKVGKGNKPTMTSYKSKKKNEGLRDLIQKVLKESLSNR